MPGLLPRPPLETRRGTQHQRLQEWVCTGPYWAGPIITTGSSLTVPLLLLWCPQSVTVTSTRTRVTLTGQSLRLRETWAEEFVTTVSTTQLETTVSSANRFTTSIQRVTSETPTSASVSSWPLWLFFLVSEFVNRYFTGARLKVKSIYPKLPSRLFFMALLIIFFVLWGLFVLNLCFHINKELLAVFWGSSRFMMTQADADRRLFCQQEVD